MELLALSLKLIEVILYFSLFILCSKKGDFKPFYRLSLFIITMKFIGGF